MCFAFEPATFFPKMASERFRKIAARYIAHTGQQSEVFQHDIKVTLTADLKVHVYIDVKKQLRRAKTEARMLRENLIDVVNSIMKEFDDCPSGECEDRYIISCRCENSASVN